MSLRVKIGPPARDRADTTRSARNSRAYRERLQQNTEEWERFKATEAACIREYRARRSAERKQKDRENGKIRQRRYYLNRKLKENLTVTSTAKKSKILTRSEKEAKKEYNRIKKQESRARLMPQQKRRQRERDAEYMRIKRAASKKKHRTSTCLTPGNPSEQAGFSTAAARRMALSRTWAKIPHDPEKFADIIEDLICKKPQKSPNKKAALKTRGLISRRHLFFDDVSDQLKSTIKQLKKRRDKNALRDRRLLVSALISKKYRKSRMQKFLSNELELKPNYLSSVAQNPLADRKKIKDATCLDVVKNIQNFYADAKISRELPNMRPVKRNQERRIMEMSINKAYQEWKENNPEHNMVSFSVFRRLRPENVLIQHKTKFIQCLCEICTDIMLKLQTFNRTVTSWRMGELKIKDKYALIKATLCPTSEKYSNPKCVYRTCSECGIALLKQKLTDLCEKHGNILVKWNKWETVSYAHQGNIKKKKVQKTTNGSLSQLIDELLYEAVDLAKHIFLANWQQDNFSQIRAKLPQHWAVLVMDFAENYSCVNQDEIQAAHWTLEQVTLHPVVAYYHCEHGDVVQEAIVFISEDLQHDCHAVHHFETLAIKYLKEVRHLSLTNIVEYTDGCSAQYKSRTPFADISYSTMDHNLTIQRCFFGSRHGKSSCDGVSGVVKSAVRRAVSTRNAVVNNASDMFQHCQEHLVKNNNCQGQRRSFFFVKKGDINRNRPDRDVKVALPGTRLLHAVRAVQPGIIDTRMLSCFCNECLFNLNPLECEHSVHVTPWQRRALKMVNEPVKQIPQDSDDVDSSISDFSDIQSTRELENIEDLWKKLENRDPSLNNESCVLAECSSLEIQPLSYPEGTYINVLHGSEVYPAVVDGWPWVNYFQNIRSDLWVLQETRHTVLPEDVMGTLNPPDIQLIGSRVFYRFDDR